MHSGQRQEGKVRILNRYMGFSSDSSSYTIDDDLHLKVAG
jgi:hypothetical protein